MMDKSVVQVEVKSVLATSAGSAVFLGNAEKVFVIYVDHSVGSAINMFLHGTPKPRPQTHDLFGDVLTALGARVERVVINDFTDTVFFARLIIVAENELEERKIIEIDARPSDSIALAVQAEAPIYVASHVWEAVEDMSIVLKKMQEASGEQDQTFPGL
jgi:bifunctional DNase/RNase